MAMDIHRLNYFCTIVNSGSLRKASEIIGISSPALSKAMKLFEEELGVELFTQEGRQLIPTTKGLLLAQEGLRLLKSVDVLKDKIQEEVSATIPVKVATFEVFSTYFLSFLNKIDWDERSLVLNEVLPGELEKAVADATVDFGISYLPVVHPELDFMKITSIEMGVYTHADKFKGLAQTEIPFVVPVMPLFGNASRVRGLDGWPEDAYIRKIKYQVTLLESALELSRQGRCAGYFPSFVVAEHNKRVKEEFHLRRCDSPYKGRVCTTDVFLIKRKSEPEGKILKQMAKAIRLVCAT